MFRINPFNKEKETTFWKIVDRLFQLKDILKAGNYTYALQKIIPTLRLLADLLENEIKTLQYK